VLRIENFADAGEGVDFSDGLVWAEADDAREAQGEAAVVAVGALNIVEGDLEDDGGFDVALEAAVFGGVLEKILSEFTDLDIREAGVGFANVDETTVVSHGEGVIGEQTAALAVAVFGDGDDDVEGGERALELHPELAAAAGNVGRLGGFGEEAFVAGVEGEEETIFDFFDRAAKLGASELEGGLLDFG